MDTQEQKQSSDQKANCPNCHRQIAIGKNGRCSNCGTKLKSEFGEGVNVRIGAMLPE